MTKDTIAVYTPPPDCAIFRLQSKKFGGPMQPFVTRRMDHETHLSAEPS
ncbi:hypothetical protein SPIRO4BDMA_40880 [uncultured spirochete]|uniref:Uncharacterized protein n=1 Tax=uncultured spirochete TaxID=156406 RepID=A0A3P3XPU4_9SPIR|nr:hypothetical protein SPIRO4BDMA_40880 [uncultured spirochete]